MKRKLEGSNAEASVFSSISENADISAEKDGMAFAMTDDSLLVPSLLKTPSVTMLFRDLFEIVHATLASPVASAGQPASQLWWKRFFRQLQQLFEFFFEDALLYPDEKQLLHARLTYWRSQRIIFADEFGAYYFLRFLILLTTSTTDVDDLTNFTGSGPVKKQVPGGILKHSQSDALCELLRCSFAMLDDKAHVLFY